MTKKKLRDASRASIKNKTQIIVSEHCGCYYCFHIFRPEDVTEWVDGGETAVCPRCGIDSVLGSASGYQIEPDVLKELFEFWFKPMEFTWKAK